MTLSANCMVSGNGEVDTSFFQSLSIESDETLSVVCALGAFGLKQGKLLDEVFQTKFAERSPNHGVAASFVEGEDSAVMTEARHHIAVLDVEPFDGPDRGREEARERASHLAVSLADVVFFVTRMQDLHRFETNGVSVMRASLTEMFLLQEDGIVPTPSGKRGFMIVVRDYEAEVLSRQEIISGFLQEMQNVYNSVAKPPRSPQRITEIFEFELALLPNATLQPQEHADAIRELQNTFLDPASDDYLFEGSRYIRNMRVSLAESADNAWKKLNEEQTADMPQSKELMSTFDCDNAMRKVFEKYQRGVRVWRRETEGGVIIEGFGSAAANMIEQTIAVFDQDAAAHKGSKAFKRKRDELKELLDADLYSLFVTQIAKLREVTQRLFKDKLSETGDDDARLEKTINSALKDSQKYFKENAEALRPRVTNWRYDNDSKELDTQLRDDATDRLQRARLAQHEAGTRRRGLARLTGSSGGKKRQPIEIGFHYLDPAPFGWRDSRYEKLSTDDDIQFKSTPALEAGGTGAAAGGPSMPLMPSRDSSWYRKNQDFIYNEKK